MAVNPESKGARSESTFALLTRHRAGDGAALETLVARYYARVERIVRVRMGAGQRNPRDVADVVQDVFVRVVEGLESFECRSDARWIDWVARLAQNEILNRARHDRAARRGGGVARRVRILADSASGFDLAADTTNVPAKVARREAEGIVDQCLSKLSEPHREVILMRDYAGADWRTVAETMNRPTPEACQELHRRARAELARRLSVRP